MRPAAPLARAFRGFAACETRNRCRTAPSVPNGKIGKLSQRRLISHHRFPNVCGHVPGDSEEEALDFGGRPLGDCFNPAVREISDKAGDRKPAGNPAGRLPEANALHASRKKDYTTQVAGRTRTVVRVTQTVYIISRTRVRRKSKPPPRHGNLIGVPAKNGGNSGEFPEN